MARERPFKKSRLELDDERIEAFWDGQRLELSSECYMVLQLLARAPDMVHTPKEIMEAANIRPGKDFHDYVRPIKRIQFAFAKAIRTRGYIKVVRQQGYKWSEPKPSVVQDLLNLFRRRSR
jgi:DNA-binding response OmpR family regulator